MASDRYDVFRQVTENWRDSDKRARQTDEQQSVADMRDVIDAGALGQYDACP
jgi:hypothetical protein